MKITFRTFLHRIVTYPLLLPLMIVYASVDNKRVVLDFFYWIRGIPHGYLRDQTRTAFYKGLKITFPFKEDPSFDDVWLRDVYQAYVPRKGDVVIDVGAHMGFFALKESKFVKKVIAFEPDPLNFKFLLQNIYSNNLGERVVPCNFALGEKNGEAFIDEDVYGHGRSKIVNGKTGFSCQMRMLDDLVSNLCLASINLIKIDTEGLELSVLNGSIKTLNKYKPDLIIAAYHFPKEYLLVSSFLKKHGYSVFYYYIPYFLSGGKEIYLYAKNLSGVSESLN